jgi:AbiTii
MQLLDEIITLLSDQKGSLTDALLKTKVVMHKIGHKELAEWVNDELNGYPKDKDVPPYRIIPARPYAQLRDIAFVYNNQALPTGHLKPEERDHLTVNKMRESIAVLEGYSKHEGHLISPLPPEFHKRLSEPLTEGIWIDRAWIQTEPSQIVNTVVEVRSRLLDFALSLQDRLGDVEEADVKEAAKGIDAVGMFHHTVIGDNATFVIGNQNTTTIKNVVKNGDFASLAAALKERGVADTDVQELRVAITADEDQVDAEKKTFGPAVKGWMSRMMTKVVEASWNIELGVAGGLLTEALKAYYF